MIFYSNTQRALTAKIERKVEDDSFKEEFIEWELRNETEVFERIS